MMTTKAIGYSEWEPSQSKSDTWVSPVQFPISVQRSPLDFLLIQ
jgi:hypothetical protein